ncbi:hypothetical protein ACQEU6_08925 [Spirillospora sp. CA-108201]
MTKSDLIDATALRQMYAVVDDLIHRAVQTARAEWETTPGARAHRRLADKYSVAAKVLCEEEEAKDAESVNGAPLSDAERIEQIMTMHSALLQPEAIELRGEVKRLCYERRLLGAARAVLDQVATGGLRGWVQAQPQAARLAQRIVDEIGHPATDEQALGSEYRDAIRQLRADLARARSDLAGRGAAYEVLAAKAQRLWSAYMSARRGRARERERHRAIALAVQVLVDEWEETIASGLMHGQEWEQCLRSNLPRLRAAAAGETTAG